MSTETEIKAAQIKQDVSSVQQSDDPFDSEYRAFFNPSGMCIASLDPQIRVVNATSEFLLQFGRASAEGCGTSFCDLLHPAAREKVEQQFALLVEGGHARFTERIVAMRPTESSFAAELTGIAVHEENNRVGSIIVLVLPDLQYDPQLLIGRKRLLSAVDARILEGVAAGISTIQLAPSLHLSRGGIEYHVSTLLRKFKVTNRSALISKAHATGMFTVGHWPPKVLPEYIR